MEIVNFKVEQKPGCIVFVSYTVPVAIAAEAYKNILKAYAAFVQIPGFRKGKAPVHLVEQRYRDRVVADAADKLLQASVEAVLAQDPVKEHDLISSPRVLRVSDYAPDRPLDVELRLDVAPALSPRDYKGLKLVLKPAPVTDDEVDAELARIAESQATVQTVERAAVMGDIVIIDLQSRKPDGTAIPNVDGVAYPVILGSNRHIPGFEEALVGSTAGETRTFSLTIPEDFPSEELRGQKVEFTVTVAVVRERRVPAIDDDLARDVNHPDLEALKKNIREHLAREKEAEARKELEADLLEKIRAANPATDLPEAMVEEEVAWRQKKFERGLKQMRMTAEQYFTVAKTDEAEHRDELRRVAREIVHSELVLRAIARKENIRVSNEELSMTITRTAMHNDMSPQVLADRLGEEGKIPDLKFDLLKRKVLHFLLENADIDRGEVPAEAEAVPAGDAVGASSAG